MTKKRRYLVVLAAILALILVMLSGYFYWYKTTKQLTFNGIASSAADTISPPQFLFAFSGTGFNRLQRPIGVLVDSGRVYVTDSVRARIFMYNENGDLTGSFGASQTANPLYLAKNPKDGYIYVTDRDKFTILKFKTDGKYVGEFKPNLPKNQLPKFKTRGVQWAPLAIAFGRDGTMYVTEILNGHRLLVFSPTGVFEKSVGTAAMATDPSKGPDAYQFPNGITVIGNQVFVADSNNQRVKVYDLHGNFKRMIVTQGLPRGLVGLDRFSGQSANAPTYFVEVDTLSHDATIWTTAGDRILTFGEQGSLDGQFSYPDGIARGSKNKLYIADTANGRVQVWGWPAEAASIPLAAVKFAPWCLLLLLLLPLPLLLRKREYFATADFVETMIRRDAQDVMLERRARWRATQVEYEKIIALDAGSVDLAQVFSSAEYSESDVRAAMDKYEIDEQSAITLTTARRAHVACSESEELRKLAKIMEFKLLNAAEFVEKYDKKRSQMPHDTEE